MAAEARSLETAGVVRRLVVPRLLQVARDRGWWDPLMPAAAGPGSLPELAGTPTIRAPIDAAAWERLALAPRVVAPSDPMAGHGLILAAIRDGAQVAAAVEGSVVVGLAIAGPVAGQDGREVLAIGVAPSHRRRGLGSMLLGSIVDAAGTDGLVADVTLAERDPVGPLDRGVRAEIGRRLFDQAGFETRPAAAAVGGADRGGFPGDPPGS